MPYYKYFSKKPPTCPRCELRPVMVYRSGRQGQSCAECRAAEQALQYYWRTIGMPLQWNKQPRRWLQPLPPRVRVAA